MSYQYNTPPTGKKIVWIRLIKEFDEPRWKDIFPKDMKVGDVTWFIKGTDDLYDSLVGDVYLFERNRYGGNFHRDYFIKIKGPEDKETIYEVY